MCKAACIQQGLSIQILWGISSSLQSAQAGTIHTGSKNPLHDYFEHMEIESGEVRSLIRKDIKTIRKIEFHNCNDLSKCVLHANTWVLIYDALERLDLEYWRIHRQVSEKMSVDNIHSGRSCWTPSQAR